LTPNSFNPSQYPASSSGIVVDQPAAPPPQGTLDSSKQTPADVLYPSNAALDDDDDFHQRCKIKKNESGTTSQKQTKNKEFQCSYCETILTRRNDLTRHIQRKHPAEVADQAGNCHCSHCLFKCHKIAELRTHLNRYHNVIFQTETVTFENTAGNYKNKKIYVCVYKQG
jgi:hypothetical protein